MALPSWLRWKSEVTTADLMRDRAKEQCIPDPIDVQREIDHILRNIRQVADNGRFETYTAVEDPRWVTAVRAELRRLGFNVSRPIQGTLLKVRW